ncbi:WxL domain-containing protein [Brochothrix campestris]|uniref:Cell surface protein with WxL domain n=1 Tax=Brochothrix campestris FSL F6-1037 TaxID=1265861 RepID=W7CFG4_9LIST|nr:WxL domain-containing protein [Brochothrix campestris]EUJ35687.1 cell surface protein with WxL domain [Brochothrix campestris FSL F6-1037]
MTNIQKFGKSVAIMTILSSAIIGGVATVSADEAVGSLNSHSAIKFIPNTDPTGPVDPTDPTEPVDPTDPVLPIEPGTPGPLSIDFASNFNFGIQKITSTDEDYFAYSQGVNDAAGEASFRPHYVQVTDNRGDAAGWVLTVKQDGEFTATDADAKNKSLAGTTISLTGAEAISAATGTNKATVNDLALAPNEEQVAMTAAENAGEGTWLARYGSEDSLFNDDKSLEEKDGEFVETSMNKNNQVKLTVPGKVAKSATQYKTDLVWTLSEVPGGEESGE